MLKFNVDSRLTRLTQGSVAYNDIISWATNTVNPEKILLHKSLILNKMILDTNP